MTGFAQRLVARSAGQPSGLPLLMPRPASRFETNGPPILDEVAETTAPAHAPRVTALASGLADIQAAGRPQERFAEASGAEAPEFENRMPAQRLQSDAPPPKSWAAPPDQGVPMASPKSPERADVETQYPEHPTNETPVPANETPVPASNTRMAESPPVLADQAMPTPLAQFLTADSAKAERPAAPAISIGRIEVQFIAPEKPVAAPLSEPQRTRGFDAYARARRGMPR